MAIRSTLRRSLTGLSAALLGSLALSPLLAHAGSLPPDPSAAAQLAGGPGSTDAARCNVPYGDAPAAVSTAMSGMGSAALTGLGTTLVERCGLIGAETLTWTDRTGDRRSACLIVPPQASRDKPLPLLTFLQGSLFPATPQIPLTGWQPQTRTADLTGDPQRPGFILLVPIGRNTHHFYPFPDEYAPGWDNWYRNLDRNSPWLNLDAAAIDQFIEMVKARGIVDANRQYMTGWSNGAAMAQLYALNTPSVAAAAVYSSPDPFKDVQDPCHQQPFATTLTPLMDVHNSCDIIGICQTGSAFHKDLAQRFPGLQQKHVILNALKQQVSACNPMCASQNPALNPIGNVNHLVWPTNWNQAMFKWLRDHPLSSKPQP